MLPVEVKVCPAVAPFIWLYSLWNWLVAIVYAPAPGAGAVKAVLGKRLLFVQPEEGGDGCEKLMLSMTTQKSPALRTAWIRTKTEVPLAGVHVLEGAAWHVVLDAFVKVVPAVVQGPLALVAYCIVNVQEPAADAAPVL
jgi:hypothetical protein